MISDIPLCKLIICSSRKMKYLLFGPWIFHLFGKITESLSTIDCPQYSHTDFQQIHNYDFPLDCTLRMSCDNPLEIYSDDSATYCPEEKKFREDDFLFDCYPEKAHACTMRHKVTMMRNWEIQTTLENPCSNIQHSSRSSLFSFPGNCSLFYKCDWGSAIFFECPSKLHFNSELQVCDWPWQARCDFTWNECPRPYPRCPTNYPRPLYLPHPRVCDKFYQCDRGTSHLQTCPAGLHFNSELKICDWPYRANCQIC